MNQESTQPSAKFSMQGVSFEVIEQGTIRIGGTDVYQPGAQLGMAQEFAVTTLEQREGKWVTHPIEQGLRKSGQPLRVIPISVPYDDPDLVIQSRLTAFDSSQDRIVCRGTETGCARRRVNDQVVDVECSGPDSCAFAQQAGIECKWFGRLRVHIGDSDGADPTRVFVLRSAGQHTLRGVEASLRQYRALFGGLRGIPLQLTMNAGTTAASDWQRFEFVSLSLRDGESPLSGIKARKQLQDQESNLGLDFAHLEDAVREGMANSEFARNAMEGLLSSEFFPVQAQAAQPSKLVPARAALSFGDIGFGAVKSPALTDA